MAQTHRELAVAPDDWFGKGIHDEGPTSGPQLPMASAARAEPAERRA